MKKLPIDTGAPIPADVDKITATIMDNLGSVDLESGLTVLCNLLGQIVCALSKGTPSLVQAHGNTIAENVKKVALIKLLHDDAGRREAEKDAG